MGGCNVRCKPVYCKCLTTSNAHTTCLGTTACQRVDKLTTAYNSNTRYSQQIEGRSPVPSTVSSSAGRRKRDKEGRLELATVVAERETKQATERQEHRVKEIK